MSSPDSEDPSQKKKRTRSAAAGEDAAGKKTRGRPRVATQDATAADRRRTQIRLAQRAYRQRKETTIASLQERNLHLQAIINQMNKHVVAFSEAAANSSVFQLDTLLSQHLKQVNASFAILLKSACEENVDGDEETAESMMVDVHDTSEPVSQGQQQPLPAQSSDHGKRVNIGWGYSAEAPEETRRNWEFPQEFHTHEGERNFSSTSTAPRAPMYHTNDYDPKNYRPPVRVGQVMDQAISWNSIPVPERGESSELPFGMVNVSQPQPQHSGTQSPQKEFPTPEATPPGKSLLSPPSLNSLFTVPRPLKATWTYSHDETTFARRLTRAAFETGYHLLNVVHQQPATYNRIFRLWVPHKSIDELREDLKELLSRGLDEELDTWDSPFLHLGGAGTHYPRRDARGNIVTKRNEWIVRRIGPTSSHIVQVEHPTRNLEMKIDLTGFEGEWFDAFDVEGYLEHEKGVRIDPKKSFAEVLVDDTDDDDATPDSPKEFSPFNNLGGRALFPYNPARDTTPPPPPPPPAPRQSSDRTTNTLNSLFPQSHVPPFSLDLGMSMPSSMPPLDFDLFDEAIGLDLAPDFTMHTEDAPPPPPPHLFNTPLDFHSAIDVGPLGLDLMGAGVGHHVHDTGHARPRGAKKKTAWLDVSRMIEEMLQHAVCLGRMPGFRRKDVDQAFKKCLITMC